MTFLFLKNDLLVAVGTTLAHYLILAVIGLAIILFIRAEFRSQHLFFAMISKKFEDVHERFMIVDQRFERIDLGYKQFDVRIIEVERKLDDNFYKIYLIIDNLTGKVDEIGTIVKVKNGPNPEKH